MYRHPALFALGLALGSLAACSPPAGTDAGAETSIEVDVAANDATGPDESAPDVATPPDGPAITETSVSPDGSIDSGVPTDAPTASDAPLSTDGPAASDAPRDVVACMPTGGAAPDLMGPGTCSTLEFGQPAAPVMNVTAPITFTGGAIPPGIYDAVSFSRTEGSLMTSFRATLVIAADGRYTEVRSLSTGSGTPPITRKSGTFTITDNALVRTATCGGADGGPEENRLTYRVDCNSDGVLLHMGLANLWFTYRRR